MVVKEVGGLGGGTFSVGTCRYGSSPRSERSEL